ncbi:TraR/DksA family transcriptional regulator [Rhizobium sp. P38BS-XIX]|nr:TraR/DksA C4-type zinc finger protein [Rhizobium sp. P38BS-XIX]NLS00196.1 TraR/DksA family transcriptional regulator [Rhizobium sp. P38BS-XIX]
MSERDFELADRRSEQEREAQIAAASRALQAAGTTECRGCGCSIALARLRVHPSASRCAECQTDFERDQSLK